MVKVFFSKKRLIIFAVVICIALVGIPAFAAPVENSNGITLNESGDFFTTFNTYTGLSSQTYNTGVINVGIGNLDATGVTNITSIMTGTSASAHGVRVHSGGRVILNDISITASGGGSKGLYALGTGSSITVNGNLVVNTLIANGNTSLGSNGIHAEANTSITVNGTTNITTAAAGSFGVFATDGGHVRLEGQTTIRGSKLNVNHGMYALNGGVIDAGTVDILIEVPNSGTKTYTYGILATGNGLSSISKITIEGGTIISRADSVFVPNTSLASNSAIRAADSAEIIVTGDLEIVTNGLGARGVYATDDGYIGLNNTKITVTGWLSPSIQVGKDQGAGAGGYGRVESRGHLDIDHRSASVYGIYPSAPAIYLESGGSTLKADFDTSKNTITAITTAIMFGKSDGNVISGMIASFNNATIRTTTNTANLIVAGGNLTEGSELNLKNSTVTAATRGWLVYMSDRGIDGGSTYDFSTTLTPADSNLVVNASNTKLIGSVTINKTSGSTTTNLVINLTDGSLWELVPNYNTRVSTLTSLNIYDSTVDASSGNYNIIANVRNAGSITLAEGNSNFKTLTVTGNYVGGLESGLGEGVIILNAVLGDDTSSADKVVISGSATGKTRVDIVNIGGIGALTTNGIEIIETNSSFSNTFYLTDRIIVGAYDYFLERNSSNNNWYLVSKYTLVPSTSSYIANLADSNKMFESQLHDQRYFLMANDDKYGIWTRYVKGYSTFQDDAGRIQTKSETDTIQLGVNLATINVGKNSSLHLGIMGGYGVAKSESEVILSSGELPTRGMLKGFAFGINATLYTNKISKLGLYFDVQARVNYYDAFVYSEYDEEEYKLMGLVASIEAGYPVQIALGISDKLGITPKAQIVWHNVGVDTFIDSRGMEVETESGYFEVKAGIRLDYTRYFELRNSDFVQPFGEFNVIYNNKAYEVSYDGISEKQAGTEFVFEVKLGVDLHLFESGNLAVGVSKGFGSDSYNDISIFANASYGF